MLIVDDEPAIVEVLLKELSILSYTVHKAFSGAEALQILASHSVDVLVTDLRMPNMEGLELVRQAVKIRDDLQSIVLTGHGDMKNTLEALNSGVGGYLRKPPDLDELVIHIERAMERIETRRALIDAKTYTDSILASMVDALVVVTPKGMIRTVNGSMGRLSGFSEEALLGSSINDRVDAIEPWIQSGVIEQLDTFLAVKGGHRIPVLISGSIMNDARGMSKDVLLILRDMTEFKKNEAQLQYASFQAGVAEMSVSILHNIGNAILGISHRSKKIIEASNTLEKRSLIFSDLRSLVQKKRDQGQTSEQIFEDLLGVLEGVGRKFVFLSKNVVSEHAHHIKQGIHHISEIIQVQQDAARPNLFATQFNLKQLLENAISIQADILEKHAIQVQIRVSREVETVTLPRSQLLQLMINLVKNSQEAIRARTDRESEPGRIHIIAQSIQDGLELRVIDNGCGIPPSRITDIFQYGYTMKTRGNGFGLHSAATFVQSQEGRIAAISQGENLGAEIVLSLKTK